MFQQYTVNHKPTDTIQRKQRITYNYMQAIHIPSSLQTAHSPPASPLSLKIINTRVFPSLTTSPQSCCHHQPPSTPSKNIERCTCFYHCVYLVQAKVSVSFSDGFTEAVREWIEHAVVWVHWRQAVLFQLISHNAHKLFHPLIIVSPVTHNLREREGEKFKLMLKFTISTIEICKRKQFPCLAKL